MRKSIAVALLALAVNNVHAQEACSLYSMLMGPGFLFFNTGTYAGGEKKVTSFSVIECQKKDSPFYAAVVPIVPGTGAGLEGDVRTGARFTAIGLNIDISGALYNYKVDKDQWWKTANVRAMISKPFAKTLGGTLTPYVWLDEQLPLQVPRETYFGGRAGLNYSATLASLPGQPTLGLDVSSWHYFVAPTLGKTIFVQDISLAYHPKIGVPGLTIGPYVRLTEGAVGRSNMHRHMIGLFTAFAF